VADAFEVMTAVRAYKRPLSLQAARAELTRKSGTQFDPTVVRAFLNVSRRRVHWTLGMAAWLAELPFLAALPRTLVQLQALTGAAGAVSPAALPGIAAASLGAMAVVIPLHPSGPRWSPTIEQSAPPAAASSSASASSTPGPSTAASATAFSATRPDAGSDLIPGTVTVPAVTVPGVTVFAVPTIAVPTGPVVLPTTSTVTAALSPLAGAVPSDGDISRIVPIPSSPPEPVPAVLADHPVKTDPVTTVAHDVGATVPVVDHALGSTGLG
jgi:hypothetical protein